MKNFKRFGLAVLATSILTSPAFAQQQASTFETSGIIQTINGIAVTIVAIGGAAFSIYALIFAYKTIRTMVRGG